MQMDLQQFTREELVTMFDIAFNNYSKPLRNPGTEGSERKKPSSEPQKHRRQTFVGTSGYIYPWWFSKMADKTACKLPLDSCDDTGFYPKNISDKKALDYYSSKFSSVEINATYYKLPNPNAVKQWYDQTPSNFRFILKFSKFATTSKKLLGFAEYFDKFYDLVSPLREKLAGILIQLPPNFSFSNKKSKLDKLSPIERVVEAGKYVSNHYSHLKVYIEFRNDTWFEQKAVDLVKKSGLKMVYVSSGDKIVPDFDSGEQEHIYVRFHGTGNVIYTGNYDDEVLEYIANATKQAKTRWFVFNNTDSFNCLINMHYFDMQRANEYGFLPSAVVDAQKICVMVNL